MKNLIISRASASPAPAASSTSSPIKMKRQKRRRTRSTNSSSPSASPGRGFFIPGFNNLQPEGASQAKMSLKDVMDAAKGLTNMYLAHEIAVDKDFMLQAINSLSFHQNLDHFTIEVRCKVVIGSR